MCILSSVKCLSRYISTAFFAGIPSSRLFIRVAAAADKTESYTKKAQNAITRTDVICSGTAAYSLSVSGITKLTHKTPSAPQKREYRRHTLPLMFSGQVTVIPCDRTENYFLTE